MSMSPDDRPGIYKITNTENGKVYVGQSVTVNARLHRHRVSLAGGYHDNQYLQRSWDKYGEGCFTFEVIQRVDDVEKLTGIEQHWMDTLRAAEEEYGYNLRPAADTNKGFHHTEETKRKIGEASKRMVRTPEWNANISAGRKRSGYRHPPEVLKRMSEKMMGRIVPRDQVERSAASRRGVPLTAERRKNIGDALRGEKGCNAKLTQDQVDEIRARCLKGEIPSEMAIDYGVGAATVRDVIANATWFEEKWGEIIQEYRRTHSHHMPKAAIAEMSARQRGEGSHYAKLTQIQVDEIRERYLCGESASAMAGDYGVRDETVRNAAFNNTWTDEEWGKRLVVKRRLLSDLRGDFSVAVLTLDQVAEIRERYLEGEVPSAIADDYGVAVSTIRKIVSNKTWKNEEWSGVIRQRRKDHSFRLKDEYLQKIADAHRGEKSHLAKLTWEKVRKIRAEYTPRVVTYRMLAKRYGVHKGTISNVIQRKSWIEDEASI